MEIESNKPFRNVSLPTNPANTLDRINRNRTNVPILEEVHINTRLVTKVYQSILKYFGHISRQTD